MSSITLMEKLTRNLEHIDRPRENLKPHNGPIPSSAPFPPQGRLPPNFQSDLGRSPVLLWTAHSAALRRWPRPASPGAARGRVRCPAAPGLPGGPHCAWERPGGVRRCLRRPPSPALGRRLMAWGFQVPGWDAVTSPGDPGTTRAAAVQALGAASRSSGPLGRPGPASRWPTPRSRQLSRPHPGRSEPRTLECRWEGGEENALFLPAFSSSPSEEAARASVLQGARGGPRASG